MITKRTLTLALTATLAISPASRAAADAGSLVGGLVGGVIAGAIISGANNNNKRTVNRGHVNSGVRAANRKTQTALNYFGFPAGTPDGVMGRRSRTAISGYQAFMGTPVTGRLNQFERDILIGAYDRGIAGAYDTVQLVSNDPLGARALLNAQRDIMTGAATGGGMATTVREGVTTEASAGDGDVVSGSSIANGEDTDTTRLASEETTNGLPALPLLAAPATAVASLSSYCSKVSLMTNSNGGYTTLATMSDPGLVLSEQFCLARAYAIDDGERMAAGLQGVTMAQIDSQCAVYGPALQDHVAALAHSDSAVVIRDMGSFIRDSGNDPAQLASTARICLGSGYRTDKMDVALGTALMLVALGEAPYAELVGHHLSQGFGVAQQPGLAASWYRDALDALASGTAPVFAPGQTDRAALITAAVFPSAGGGKDGSRTVKTAAPSGLPTFNTAN